MRRNIESNENVPRTEEYAAWHRVLSEVHREAELSGASELVLLLGMAILSLEDSLDQAEDGAWVPMRLASNDF